MVYIRRTFLKTAGLVLAGDRRAMSQTATQSIQTPVLSIAYEDGGDPQGFPVILLHGFPDDVRAWNQVAPPLVKAGYRVLAPYLRGYGPTRFRDAAGPRMAEQAAIGQDVIDFAELFVPAEAGRAWFSHGRWLRLFDTAKGIVVGRWHFPGEIVDMVPKRWGSALVLLLWSLFLVQYVWPGIPSLFTRVATVNFARGFGIPADASAVSALLFDPGWQWVYAAPALLFAANLFLVLRARRTSTAPRLAAL